MYLNEKHRQLLFFEVCHSPCSATEDTFCPVQWNYNAVAGDSGYEIDTGTGLCL